MKHFRYTMIILCVLLIVVLSVFTGCSHQHKWLNATCTEPQTCKTCRVTKGDPAPHSYGSTSCIAPEPCTVCGTIEGIELTHQWQPDGSKLCVLCGYDDRSVDNQFITALQKGLEQSLVTITADEYLEVTLSKEDWSRAFSTEYACIKDFRHAEFEDPGLKNWALKYIDAVEGSIDVLPYYGTDDWYALYYNWQFHHRGLALYRINKICPLTVSEDLRDELQVFLDDGAFTSEVTELCLDINFHTVVNTDGVQKFEAFVENTTEKSFRKLTLELEMLDKDNNIVATQSILIRNWEPGQKRTLRFTTDADFKTIRVAYATWFVKG